MKVFLRDFKCPECGTTMQMPKRRLTGNGHIKTMWCPRCKQMRDFVQQGHTSFIV